MSFSLKKIKAPTRGLLSMHPFVDVLEGRSLFTATAHDTVLAIECTIDAAPPEHAVSPWSNQTIGGEAVDVVEAPATALARQTAPHHFELKPETHSSFSDSTIGDGGWALFGNALHDRRGRFESQPIPSDEAIAAAREARSTGVDTAFSDGRSLSGAMAPFLTMSVAQENHPFAA